jgi:hypothetical protein
VLASMLYDFYQLASGGETFRRSTAMALIAILYLLDYFHLFVDLKELTRYPMAYDFLDLLIAVLFGLAFTFAKLDKLDRCQACVVAILLLMLAYSLFERSEHMMPWRTYVKARWIYCALAAIGMAQMALGQWSLLELYLAVVCALYVAHIILIWRSGSTPAVAQLSTIQLPGAGKEAKGPGARRRAKRTSIRVTR